MHELHEPLAQGNPDTGNSEITSSVPDNSELLEFSLPPRRCEQCGKPFDRRKHGGGSPQRFCNQDCRIAWHAAQRKPACTLEAAAIDPALEQYPEDAPEGGENFSWTSDENVVLREQPATAVYFNQSGGFVIRQERAWYQDDDPFIHIAPNCIEEFIDKLTDLAGVPSFGRK